ncbi:MAG: hypothetical protein A3K19_10890 [Lentisphaerae bacterium RIFOXYB12_FULL_65_16]|nr:MAG: hypothetical protein A3K18_28615 [Lentisphaerae bacterium RIFOXYA12_64_32]OGV87893.1 MAG: hypothetical protein A3K19_10890 [Lentisphaerae bacterium RIFOXYB12_FULL_65_16]
MPTRHFRYREILETLDRFAVEYIVVGGVCAVAHGAPITTFDLDLVHLRTAENIDRTLAALTELEACHREPGDRRLAPQRWALEGAAPALFTTKHGSLDFIGELSGRGYEELLAHTVELVLGADLRIRILNLETLIEVKASAGRPKDLAVLPILRQTLVENRRQRGD